VDHGILEWLKEVFLELEAWQFFLLQEPHSQLSQGVKGEITDVNIAVAANLTTFWISRIRVTHASTYLVEMLPNDDPHVRPLDTNALHIISTNFDKFSYREQPRVVRLSRRLDLFPRNVTERLDVMNDGSLRMSGQKNSKGTCEFTYSAQVFAPGEYHICSDSDVSRATFSREFLSRVFFGPSSVD